VGRRNLDPGDIVRYEEDGPRLVLLDPRRLPARNPAFDVTPGGLITAIVTEHGVHLVPYEQSLAALV
jgi:methylthioribose-1-phosphate isomerase